MKVSVIFDPVFSGTAGQAVWIVNTPANREWFERQSNLAVGSAIFLVNRYASLEEAAISMVWNAQEHHPSWQTISVEGGTLTPHIITAIADEGQTIAAAAGFVLYRA